MEAFTWAGLLTGMYFKYVPETTDLGVRIFGSLHGAAFITYVLVTISMAVRLKWRLGRTLLAMLVAVPPFMTVVFEVWARRTGRLPGTAVTSAFDPVTASRSRDSRPTVLHPTREPPQNLPLEQAGPER